MRIVLILCGMGWMCFVLYACPASVPLLAEEVASDASVARDVVVEARNGPEERVFPVPDTLPDTQTREFVSESVVVDQTHTRALCEVTGNAVSCTSRRKTIPVGTFVKTPRTVLWQLPQGTPPTGGWPVAIMFQGSFLAPKWSATKLSPYGEYHQMMTIRQLLQAGFAVLTPWAQAAGNTFWNTNIAPYIYNWSIAPDHLFMKGIFAAIEQGEFGPLNQKAMYAFGISSGGYMTSRMAVSYAGRFRALVIHSASYATCGGSLCVVPALPKDHPPTLFLHGKLDSIVPLWTAKLYISALQKQQTKVMLEVDEKAGHEWLKKSPALVVDWFQKHSFFQGSP